jgi:hypothetical protein
MEHLGWGEGEDEHSHVVFLTGLLRGLPDGASQETLSISRFSSRLIESRWTRLRQTIATVSTLPKMDLNHAAGHACFSSLRAVSWEGEETRLTIGRRQAASCDIHHSR